MPTVIIADDHVVLRQGLRFLVDSLDSWTVVAEASDGFEVLPLVEQHQPDVLILDLSMPNLGGVETISRLKRSKQQTNILVLSARDDEQSVRAAMRAGAKGFIPKSSEAQELEFALRAVLAGQTYLSPSVCQSVITKGLDANEQELSPLDVLTTREREVMKLLCEGQPNRVVAKTLHISKRTVDSHRANIMKKLGINSNAEMTQLALKYQLIE